jgi:tetratricopeptide (TPR) repeat protein
LVVLALAVGMVLVSHAAQSQSEGYDDPRTAFLTGLAPGCPPGERVSVMERIVKEFPDSDWADDALWVLGEACRQQRNLTGALRYWQYLVSRWPEVELEGETRVLDLFQASSAAWSEFLLTVEGLSFRPDTPRANVDPASGTYLTHSAAKVNTVPMAVWYDLGQVYEGLGCHEVASRAYRRARALVPAGCRLAEMYQTRADLAAAAAARGAHPPLRAHAPLAGQDREAGPPEAGEDTPHAKLAGLAQPAEGGDQQ